MKKKHTREELEAMTRKELAETLKETQAKFKAMQALARYCKAQESDDFEAMALAVGLTHQMAVDMTGEEIMQALMVRAADLARIVGIKPDGDNVE